MFICVFTPAVFCGFGFSHAGTYDIAVKVFAGGCTVKINKDTAVDQCTAASS